MRRHSTIPSTLGELTLAADEGALTGVTFAGHHHPPDPTALGPFVVAAHDAVLGRAAHQLGRYLAGESVDFDLELAPAGTDFQRAVWDRLRQIRRGTTTTYGRLAESMGGPSWARAVGAAVGRNPLSIVVPCHRVVGADGSLTGFAGGLARKVALLRLEGVTIASDGGR